MSSEIERLNDRRRERHIRHSNETLTKDEERFTNKEVELDNIERIRKSP